MKSSETAWNVIERKEYKTPRTLENAVSGYFKKISRTVTLTEDGQPVCGDDGSPIQRLEYLRPPSIADLCLNIGIDCATWDRYCDNEKHPEFSKIVNWAATRIEAYLEEELLTRHNGFQGIQYHLQNLENYRSHAAPSVCRKTLSLEEKLALIEDAHIAAEQNREGDEDAAE